MSAIMTLEHRCGRAAVFQVTGDGPAAVQRDGRHVPRCWLQQSTSHAIHSWHSRAQLPARPTARAPGLSGIPRAASTSTSEMAIDAIKLCGTRWNVRTRRMVASTSRFQANGPPPGSPAQTSTKTESRGQVGARVCCGRNCCGWSLQGRGGEGEVAEVRRWVHSLGQEAGPVVKGAQENARWPLCWKPPGRLVPSGQRQGFWGSA